VTSLAETDFAEADFAEGDLIPRVGEDSSKLVVVVLEPSPLECGVTSFAAVGDNGISCAAAASKLHVAPSGAARLLAEGDEPLAFALEGRGRLGERSFSLPASSDRRPSLSQKLVFRLASNCLSSSRYCCLRCMYLASTC
jgi:hypothetical protein